LTLSGNKLFSDTYTMANSTGGNDTLISGKGNDFMWGDFGGKEKMSSVTGATFGQDIIYDFHRDDGDKIKLIDETTIAGKITTSADGLNNVITFSEGNAITVIGVTDLTVSDFIFA
jgi:Ca2+-binding RTX toxin-like protein